MRVTFLGVGAAFSRHHSNSSIMVESGSTRLVIDCGRSVPGVIERLKLDWPDVTHLLITHLHADHIGGLEEVALLCRLMHRCRIRLLATPTLLARLWDSSLRGGLEFIEETRGKLEPLSLPDFFELCPLQPEQWISLADEQGLRIKLHTTNHVLGLESYGVELEDGIGGSAHRALFSGDTRFAPHWIQQGVEACRWVFHDCQMSDFGPANSLGVHTSYNQLLTLPDWVKARLWLYHYGDDTRPDALDAGFAGFVSHLQRFEI